MEVPKIVMSDEGSEYRKSENERSSQYYYDNKQKSSSEGFKDIDNLPFEDDTEMLDDDEYRKSLSRQR